MSTLKLLFLVEGDQDKAFIEALVPRVLANVALRVVRVGGKAAFRSTYYEATKFLEAGYAAAILLVDADTEVASEIEIQKQELVEIFRRYGVDDRVRVVMAVPMLETWLLAAHRDHPARSTQPKRDLARAVGVEPDYGVLAAALPIDLVRRRAPSFDELVTELESFAVHARRRAS